MKPNDVPIPEQMRDLPTDHRGYPVPVNVARDRHGNPVFTINDSGVVDRLFREDRCGICGRRLLRGRWSMGGPGSAFHEDGAFIDPPMHYECARYALQACPYLALTSYRKSLSPLKPGEVNFVGHWLAHNPTEEPDRPPMFVLVMYVGQRLNLNGDGSVRSLVPKKPYRKTEYWSGGVQIDDHVGEVAVRKYLSDKAEEWERRKRLASG